MLFMTKTIAIASPSSFFQTGLALLDCKHWLFIYCIEQNKHKNRTTTKQSLPVPHDLRHWV